MGVYIYLRRNDHVTQRIKLCSCGGHAVFLGGSKQYLLEGKAAIFVTQDMFLLGILFSLRAEDMAPNVQAESAQSSSALL